MPLCVAVCVRFPVHQNTGGGGGGGGQPRQKEEMGGGHRKGQNKGGGGGNGNRTNLESNCDSYQPEFYF